MIVKSENHHPIFIEIYRVDTDKFQQLIDLEKPFGYHYESIKIPDIGENVKIFVYNAGKPPDEFNLVENGYWESTLPW